MNEKHVLFVSYGIICIQKYLLQIVLFYWRFIILCIYLKNKTVLDLVYSHIL